MINLRDIGSSRTMGVVVAYLMIAFAVLEGLDVLVGALALPDWIVTVAAVLALAGFPVAGAVAWYSQRRRARTEQSADAIAPSGPSDSKPRTRAWKVAGFGALAAVVVLGAGWWFSSGDEASEDQPLDPGLVAVMPFGTGGAHPEIAWLEQGAMDLLAAKLSGEFGPRALDPRAVLSRLGPSDGAPPEDRVTAAARQLGAGLTLTGYIVGSPDRFSIHARLNEVGTGRERSRASVQSDVDGLAAAADELVIALLSLDAGEAEHRLASLTSTEPAAVRAYLSGQSHYRQGRYSAAVAAFDEALDVDSTFALAGIGLSEAAAMTLDPELLRRGPRGLRLALAARENLSPIDRRFLELRSGASEGPTYEARRRFREQAVREMPDRAELWYLLGDLYFHWGNLIDVADPLDRAERAFSKAVELDSLHYVAIQHLGWTASLRGDTASLRHYVELQKDRTDGDPGLALRLDEAMATGNLDAIREIEQSVDTAGPFALRGITLATHTGMWRMPADAADRAVRRLIETAESNTARVDALWLAHAFALNAGRPDEAAGILDRLERSGEDRGRVLRQRIRDALYWDGHPDDASEASAALEADLEDGADDEPLNDAANRCALLQWDADQGAARPAQRARLAEFAAAATAESQRVWADLCLALVDAVLAWRSEDPRASELIAALDSTLALGPANYLRDPANVALARMLGERGEYEWAARVADRLAADVSTQDHWSSLKYEKGRWAERAGDFATARAAYADYLRLRYDPEPSLAAQVEDVRRRLESISGELSG